MRLTMTLTEALTLARAARPLPSLVRSISAEGSVIQVEVDLRQIPDPPAPLRLAAAAAGTVSVTAEMVEFTAGVATFRVTAHARALPAHKLLGHIADPLESALRRRGLPAGLVTVRRTPGDALVDVAVQAAVDARSAGLTVTDLAVQDGMVDVAVAVGDVTLRRGRR